MTVGECIKSLRASAGLTQRELAERVDISAPMLSLIEADKRDPTIRVLRAVARELGLPTALIIVAALADEPDVPRTPASKRLRALTQHLVRAAQYALEARGAHGPSLQG
jgi:transcriptional regulator with XRE-family HTH domain